ncbi:hypothetical protein BDN70DRAFT_937288 [Pholiota conissans]|uniref:Uncharacterized protein n=1 Tax=Pholiota conissans TaxID=109636 RepID=A0A9P5YQI3_9AGAR|nr:hypothetical protein BDN70DRAFT_937288 [Pholiota conissans]
MLLPFSRDEIVIVDSTYAHELSSSGLFRARNIPIRPGHPRIYAFVTQYSLTCPFLLRYTSTAMTNDKDERERQPRKPELNQHTPMSPSPSHTLTVFITNCAPLASIHLQVDDLPSLH